ncbi:MAG: DNA polymerase II [Nanobdellota archaeon]
MKGFIVHPTYEIKEDKAYVLLFGRLENGESFLTINHFRPYFQIRKEDLARAKKIADFDTEDAGFRNFNDEPTVKVIKDIPSEIPDLRKKLEEAEIECYEADIRFSYRFMMDHQLSSCMEIKGEHEKGEHVDRVYKEPGIEKTEGEFKLKTLSFDIETDINGNELYSISLYSDDVSEVIFVNRHDSLDVKAKVVENEREALELFSKRVREIDPDIITGWNLIDFDLAFLEKKFKQYDMHFRIGRNNRDTRLRIQEGFVMDSKATVTGRNVLDGMHLLKNSFYRLSDYKLDTAAEELLGENKNIGEKTKGKDIEEAYRNNPQELIDYNLKDSKLVYDILKKEGIIELTMKRSLLTGMPPDRVQASVASLDSLYIKDLAKHKIVAPTAKFNKKDKGVSGGFVMRSQPGIYDNIAVCDFKSLYPSIIRTYNIDPLSFERGKENGEIIAPNGARFDKKEGFLPAIIERLWKSRDEMKKKKDKVGSFAIKIHMNSLYGVIANPSCRFYSYDMADAITSFGRESTKSAAKLSEDMGYDVIYSDTDSIFIKTQAEDTEKAKEVGKKVEEKINKHFDDLVKEKYNRTNVLQMEFEKLYRRFLMPHTRGSKEGAKKRYAGLLVKDDGKEDLDFTGLEFVRRDWTELSKKFQLELIWRIFRKQEVESYIKDFVKKLKEGKLDDLLVYRKALRKSTDEYIKTTPPHVKAARKLEEKGKLESNIIDYMITIDGPEPVQYMENEIDYEHYIEKQIKPIADSVLVFFDKSFDSITAKTSQKGLFDF